MINITLSTQQQVDNFNTTYPACTNPPNSIAISGEAIQNLNGLQNITSIAGDLVINGTSITNLSGLQNLTQVGGDLTFGLNYSLSSLTGLENLVSVGKSFWMYVSEVGSMQPLSKLEYIGKSLSVGSTEITDFSGMEKLTYAQSLSIAVNDNLTSLNGLQNIAAYPSVGNVFIMNNGKLADCAVKFVCFRTPDPDGSHGHEISGNAPGGNCNEPFIDVACYPMTLPVTLIHFNAEKTHENQVTLQWATSSETNSKLFQIEKNDGRGTWISLGSVDAQYESSQTAQYSFLDERPLNGINLYRLKMVDMDNTFAYSRIVAVNFDNIKTNGVYPNPTASLIQLGSDDLIDVAQVQILNTSGQVLYSATKVETEGIDVRHLTSGMYIVDIKKKNGRSVSYKVIKNK